MIHLKQTRKSNCGQTCIAMIGNTSISFTEDYIFNKKGSTTTKDLNTALNSVGFDSHTRLVRCPKGWDHNFPSLCIVKMTFTEKSSFGHWVVYYNGVVFDPSQNESQPYQHYKKYLEHYMKPTSYMGIFTSKEL